MTSETGAILIVDDDAIILHFLSKVMQRDGHQVTTASNGEQALELIATREYDLALLDLKMPGIGGMEVLARLHQQWPATSVIILTAHASLDTAVQAFRQGAHDYLFKPCATVDLRESVRTGLIRRRAELHRLELVTQLNQQAADGDETSIKPGVSVASVSAPGADTTGEEDRFICYRTIIVDPIRHVITLDGKLLDLTVIEFGLLSHLVSQAPRVVSAEELVREVQGYASDAWQARDIVRSHIYHIRRKSYAVACREIIRTVRGVGYVIAE